MCLVFLLLLATSMEKELNHDEHMYVSGGVLLAEKLQIPYRDFPYLQMPNLAFMYGGLFALLKWPGYYLLEARVFSTACATASLGLVFAVVAGTARGLPHAWSFLVAAGSVVAIMANPVFRYSSGQAWNHDASVLLALSAFVALHTAMRRGWPGGRTLLAGLLLGLAVGTRLTFAFVVPVFGAAVVIYSSMEGMKAGWRNRLRPLLTFVDGLLLGLVPSILTFFAAPKQFVFDNIDYHQVNARFWESTGYDRAMDLPGKLDYLWAVVSQPANLALSLGLLSFVVAGLVARRRASKPWRFELIVAMSVLAALLIGALVPTPSWYQYFYAAVPFAVLVSAYGAASLYSVTRWGVAAFGLVLALSAGLGQPGYSFKALADPSEWVPVQVHNLGLEVSRYVAKGKVLTFAPVPVLEGGADIYTPFAVGPFLWRSDSLLQPGERHSQGLPSREELMQQLEKEPPEAILTGFEAGLENPWIDFARAHGYEMVSLPSGKVLWVLKR
ncbi:MAG: hypothetical protein QOH93_775 [Chloroflexia bacterium]|nr:hypothetical protein [Chloroflexia bacterium]